MPKNVLLLTHSQDHFTIDLVQRALTNRGIRAIRVDTDQFPEQLRIGMSIGGPQREASLRVDGETLYSGDIHAVWLRRLQSAQFSQEIEPAYRQACLNESGEVLRIFLTSLNRIPWIDPLATTRRAADKHWQLELAQSVGLAIPRTLITNDAPQASSFYHACGGEVVAKLLTGLSRGMQASNFFVYTSAMQEKNLADLDQLRFSPMVFQSRVPKQYELRVICVDGKCFAARIDASATEHGTVDWRLSRPDEVGWQTYELPPAVTGSLRQLMRRLRLVYGAVDLIRSTNGDYVFLEVNPAGEWGMLQRDLDYPIAESIAQAFTKRL